MVQYEYRCEACGTEEILKLPMVDGPAPNHPCHCGGGELARVWSVPQTLVHNPLKRAAACKLPGINLARGVRSSDAQEYAYKKHIDGLRHKDAAEKIARGTSTKKLKGVRFERVGSIPRELVVAETRNAKTSAGQLLKEDGINLMKKHGCYWGDK